MLFGCFDNRGCFSQGASRDWSEADPPSPIPNLEVKRLSADGTALAAVWESRSLREASFCVVSRAGLPRPIDIVGLQEFVVRFHGLEDAWGPASSPFHVGNVVG